MTAPNRADGARYVTFWTAIAAEATARAAAVRNDLTAQAIDELERDGVAPTWRIPGLGTVPLALTSDTVAVTDPGAYLKWMKVAHPEEVETLVRVRPAYDEHFRKYLAQRGHVVDDEGTVIPGLEFRAGGRATGVSVRATTAAKEEAASLASGLLDSIMRLAGEVA
jgi:hypothetical protein